MQPDLQRKSILREAAWAWTGVILASSAFYQLYAAGAISADWLFFLTAFLLLNVPIAIYLKRREKVLFLEESAKGAAASVAWFLIASAVIFPLALLVNHYYQQIFFGYQYRAPAQAVPWGLIILNRLLMALPEEFFFRGYLQGRLNRAWGRPWRVLGAPVGLSLIVTSALFALSHSLIHVQWWHAFIFFPSLVFGWLQEKRGTILAPTLFHAACNVFADWAAFHYYA